MTAPDGQNTTPVTNSIAQKTSELPDAPQPNYATIPSATLPDAPVPNLPPPAIQDENSLAKINDALKVHKIHLGFFSAYDEPLGTKRHVAAGSVAELPHAAEHSSIVNVPALPPRPGPFTVENVSITPKLGGAFGFALSPNNHRAGFNTFLGGKVDGEELISHGHSITTTLREEAHAGEAHYNRPQTVTLAVPTGDAAHPREVMKTHHVPTDGLDAGVSINSDTKIPLPVFSRHFAEKSFGPDKLVDFHTPKQVDVTTLATVNTLEAVVTAGADVRVATFLDGGLTLSESYNPRGATLRSESGWHAAQGFNTNLDITDTHKIKHGLSGIINKIFHHHKGQEK